jgi:hypothetical protein
MVDRVSRGDRDEAKRIVRDDVAVAAETPEELAMLGEAQAIKPARFTSFHMCDECAASEGSPGKKMSENFEALARAIDAEFAKEIANSQRDFPE